MPNRYLRDTLRTDPRLDRTSPEAECLYFRLLMICDDYGRFDADPRVVFGSGYPLRIGTSRMHLDEIVAQLGELEQLGLVQRYEVNGRCFGALLLTTWKPRAASSKFPDPPAPPPVDNSALSVFSSSEKIRRDEPELWTAVDSGGEVGGYVDNSPLQSKCARLTSPCSPNTNTNTNTNTKTETEAAVDNFSSEASPGVEPQLVGEQAQAVFEANRRRFFETVKGIAEQHGSDHGHGEMGRAPPRRMPTSKIELFDEMRRRGLVPPPAEESSS